MRIASLLSFLGLLLLSSGFYNCKSTKKAYERGDYETAVFNSISRLRNSPKNKKSRETLSKAYPLLVEYRLERIAQEKQTNNPNKWEDIMNHYAVLQRAYDEIKRAPAAQRVVPRAKSFYQELDDARDNAAEERYQLGRAELQKAIDFNDREFAKVAYQHFQTTQSFRPNYKKSESLLQEALELATLKVLVKHIPMHSQTLALSNEFFDNQINEFIRAYQRSPFVRFITPEERRRTDIQVDQVVEMIFDDFVVGQAYVKETVFERSRDSVIVGEVNITPDSTVNVYGTVKAKVHQFQKEITSTGLLDIKIIDTYTGSVVSQEKFPGTFVYYDYWGFYNGDQKALLKEDKKYIAKQKPAPDPAPQVLLPGVYVNPSFNQVTQFISAFYDNA